MYSHLSHTAFSVGALLGVIALSLITLVLFSRRAPPKRADDFTLVEPLRAVVIDPTTQVITPDASDRH